MLRFNLFRQGSCYLRHALGCAVASRGRRLFTALELAGLVLPAQGRARQLWRLTGERDRLGN